MQSDVWTILNDFSNRRRKFNPAKREDLIELSYFKKNNKWKNGCPFVLEWPHTEIVSMCHTKYADYMLDKVK